MKAGVFAARGPEPVLTVAWLHPAPVTAEKHARPSLTTAQPESRLCLAKAAIDALRKAANAPAVSAEVGVVDHNPPGQSLRAVALEHDLAELVLDLLGGGLRHPETPTDFDTGDFCFVWVR